MKKEFTKEEESLLLYLETCAVDARGMVEAQRINKEDFEIAEKWHKEGFIKFGRMLSAEIQRLQKFASKPYSHYVILSDDAWKEVAKLRKERGKRHENVNFLIESKR